MVLKCSLEKLKCPWMTWIRHLKGKKRCEIRFMWYNSVNHKKSFIVCICKWYQGIHKFQLCLMVCFDLVYLHFWINKRIVIMLVHYYLGWISLLISWFMYRFYCNVISCWIWSLSCVKVKYWKVTISVTCNPGILISQYILTKTNALTIHHMDHILLKVYDNHM